MSFVMSKKTHRLDSKLPVNISFHQAQNTFCIFQLARNCENDQK